VVSPNSEDTPGFFRSIPGWGWALLFALALCLPRLGSFGFWDPWELKIADQAREMLQAGHLFDPTVAGRFPATNPLGLLLAALGMKLLGTSEMGARIFGALCAVGALMAVYWAGVGLFRRRAALLATLALGSMTVFVLEARQLTSEAPLIAALALALGGLGRFAWPPGGRRRALDLAAGLAGMAAGLFAGGALSGVVLPALALFAALVVGYGLVPEPFAPGAAADNDGTAELSAPGVGTQVAAGRIFGASTLAPSAGPAAFLLFWALGLAGVVLLVFAMTHVVAGRYSLLLGGVGRAGSPSHTFEKLVRELGFGLFPWSAVAVFALGRPLIRLDAADGSKTNPRLAFAELYLLIFAGLGFALSTYRSFVLGDARFAALPAVALAIGAFLDEALEGNRPEPVTGLLMATGTMIVARDFFLTPEELASVHLYDKVRWPPSIAVGNLVLIVGLIAGLGAYAGLAARGRALGKLPAPAPEPASPPPRRRSQELITFAGRWGLQASVGCAVLFAFYLAQVLVPQLSTHLSFKPAIESYSRFAKPGEKIARYRVEARGGGFYGGDKMIDLPTQDRLLAFLRDPARVFALVSADDLAALDAAFKQASEPYYVVDASSSRFLLLSNRAGPGGDANPLKKNVWMGTGQPGEKPPWSWRVPLSATFGDGIELVGADFPASIRRPGKISVDLTFHIKAKPPSGYKIFVHFDGPAAPRLIGDHDPLGKAFPTAYWLPGEYIRDHSETDAPLMTTPAGLYTVYVGFWPGGEGKRLKVTQGPNDGADRVRLGTIEIK
jgi:hypothetical protein